MTIDIGIIFRFLRRNSDYCHCAGVVREPAIHYLSPDLVAYMKDFRHFSLNSEHNMASWFTSSMMILATIICAPDLAGGANLSQQRRGLLAWTCHLILRHVDR